MGCPGPGAVPRCHDRHIFATRGRRASPVLGGQSRAPGQSTEKGALVRGAPGGQHPPGPRRMKSNCCGQAEAGPRFGGWGRPTRRSGQAAGLQADSWPGRGPVRTGVSSASGSSWGRGSSARSSARGGSCWAPPWTQLEHLQVPLLVPSPARSTQGRAEGTVDHQPTTQKGLRAPPGHPFFYGWRNRGPDRKWAAPQWAGPPGTQQDSPECLIFTPGAWPWPPRSVSQSPSLRSPRSVRQPHLQRPVAGWHKPAGRASLGRVLMPRGLATVHGGGRPAERRRPRAGRKGRTGQGERWLSLGSLPQPLRLRET